MILNMTKVKTEALLLLCKDIILTYKDNIDKDYAIDKSIAMYMNDINEKILKEIGRVTHSHTYYTDNIRNTRIKAIVQAYKFLEKELTKYLKKDSEFNPSMLYFSMLAMWFKELNKEATSKEFIYFSIYTYGNVFDKLLLNIEDLEFKKMTVKMIDIAERIILKYDDYKFR